MSKTDTVDDNLDIAKICSPIPEYVKEHGIKKTLLDIEAHLIHEALSSCNGNVTHAAFDLQMQRTTLSEKMKRYEIDREIYSN